MEWKKISERKLWSGYRKIEGWTFNLATGVSREYEINIGGATVCALALTEDGQVILVKEFRPGVGTHLMEMPGGVAENDEDRLAAMARELREETGYAGNLQFVASGPIDAYSTNIRQYFVATECRKVTEPENDPYEPLQTVLMSPGSFRDHLRGAQLTDVAGGYLCLDFLGLL